jgi:hypothetical protein
LKTHINNPTFFQLKNEQETKLLIFKLDKSKVTSLNSNRRDSQFLFHLPHQLSGISPVFSTSFQKDKGFIEYFVPAFVVFWAIGYGFIFLSQLAYNVNDGQFFGETSNFGAFVGVGLTLFLSLSLFVAIFYEILKSDP